METLQLELQLAQHAQQEKWERLHIWVLSMGNKQILCTLFPYTLSTV